MSKPKYIDFNLIGELVVHGDVHYEDLKRLPAADVEPVRRGHWLKLAKGWGSLWKCDQCGEVTVESVMGKPRANYCPYCGAKMECEQNE